mmetsp:Transcript_2320/g.6169  ORF Transcript_2320/g.6169 Transcript_2320/m.6169 type:complete len:129 (-) Transcript_2320:85-471(-)
MIIVAIACILVHLVVSDQWLTCSAGSRTSCAGIPDCSPQNQTLLEGLPCSGVSDTTCGDGVCDVVNINYLNVLLRLALSLAGVAWSLRSSLTFLSEVVKPERLVLAAYPVCLYFASIAWFVMLRTSSS